MREWRDCARFQRRPRGWSTAGAAGPRGPFECRGIQFDTPSAGEDRPWHAIPHGRVPGAVAAGGRRLLESPSQAPRCHKTLQTPGCRGISKHGRPASSTALDDRKSPLGISLRHAHHETLTRHWPTHRIAFQRRVLIALNGPWRIRLAGARVAWSGPRVAIGACVRGIARKEVSRKRLSRAPAL